jgi:hypothetical protein
VPSFERPRTDGRSNLKAIRDGIQILRTIWNESPGQALRRERGALAERRRPPGLLAARNSGLAAAQCEIVAFLDDDAMPSPDRLYRFVKPHEDLDLVAVGGWAAPAWPGGRPGSFPPEFDCVVGCSYTGLPTCQPVGVRRVGTKPTCGEETDVCIQIRQRNLRAKISIEPCASVQYRVTAIRARWRYFMSRCYAEGASKALVASTLVPRTRSASSDSTACVSCIGASSVASVQRWEGKSAILSRRVRSSPALRSPLPVIASGTREWLGPARLPVDVTRPASALFARALVACLMIRVNGHCWSHG